MLDLVVTLNDAGIARRLHGGERTLGARARLRSVGVGSWGNVKAAVAADRRWRGTMLAVDDGALLLRLLREVVADTLGAVTTVGLGIYPRVGIPILDGIRVPRDDVPSVEEARELI